MVKRTYIGPGAEAPYYGFGVEPFRFYNYEQDAASEPPPQGPVPPSGTLPPLDAPGLSPLAQLTGTTGISAGDATRGMLTGLDAAGALSALSSGFPEGDISLPGPPGPDDGLAGPLALGGMALGAGLGVPGLGIVGTGLGTLADVFRANTRLEDAGLNSLGFGEGLSAFGHNLSFGFLGDSIPVSASNLNDPGVAGPARAARETAVGDALGTSPPTLQAGYGSGEPEASTSPNAPNPAPVTSEDMLMINGVGQPGDGSFNNAWPEANYGVDAETGKTISGLSKMPGLGRQPNTDELYALQEGAGRNPDGSVWGFTTSGEAINPADRVRVVDVNEFGSGRAVGPESYSWQAPGWVNPYAASETHGADFSTVRPGEGQELTMPEIDISGPMTGQVAPQPLFDEAGFRSAMGIYNYGGNSPMGQAWKSWHEMPDWQNYMVPGVGTASGNIFGGAPATAPSIDFNISDILSSMPSYTGSEGWGGMPSFAFAKGGPIDRERIKALRHRLLRLKKKLPARR